MPVAPGGNAVSRQDVYNSFRSQGLPHIEAANFAGVVSQEGGYRGGLYTGSFGNQSTENGGVLNRGGAFGIAQWNGPRQAGLAQYAQANGLQPTDLDAQTGFAVQEARARGIDLGSTRDIVNRFEVPRADLRAGEAARAAQVAQSFDPGSYTGQSTNGMAASSDGTVRAAGGNDVTGQQITTDAGDGTITSFSGNADHADVTLGGSAPSTTSTAPAAGNPGATTGTGGSGSQSGGGVGAFITDVGRAIGNALAPATTQAGQAQASATTQAGQVQAQATTQAAQTAAAQSKATNTLFSDLSKDYFGRFVIILLGIIFVAGGVAMFVFDKNPITLAGNAVKKIT